MKNNILSSLQMTIQSRDIIGEEPYYLEEMEDSESQSVSERMKKSVKRSGASVKQEVKVGQVITVKCDRHGTHTGTVLHRDEDSVLIKQFDGSFWDSDFVAPIYDVIRIDVQAEESEKEKKQKSSRFI